MLSLTEDHICLLKCQVCTCRCSLNMLKIILVSYTSRFEKCCIAVSICWLSCGSTLSVMKSFLYLINFISGILVIYCCLTDSQQFSSLKSHILVISQYLWGQESWRGLTGSSASESLTRPQLGPHPKAQLGRNSLGRSRGCWRSSGPWSLYWEPQLLVGCCPETTLSFFPYGPFQHGSLFHQTCKAVKESLLDGSHNFMQPNHKKWHPTTSVLFCWVETTHRLYPHSRGGFHKGVASKPH